MKNLTPLGLHVNHLRAWVLGIRDGWRQPHEVGSSYNVEHLDDGQGTVYESQDRGINLGQRLRSPLHHERTEPGAKCRHCHRRIVRDAGESWPRGLCASCEHDAERSGEE